MADRTKPGEEIKTEVPGTLNISKEDLKELLMSVMTAPKQLNQLEQKAYDEEIKKQKSRDLLQTQLAAIEEEQRKRKREGCSHWKDKDTSEPVKRGTGIPNTSGQIHGNDTATLICLWCGTAWLFPTTPQFREYALNSEHGLLHVAPPPDSECISVA